MKLRREEVGRISAVIEAKTSSFVGLVRIAGLDPARDFVGADLRCVNLSGEDVSGFDFTGADLSGADLRGANLSCATGIDQAVLNDIITDQRTRWQDKPLNIFRRKIFERVIKLSASQQNVFIIGRRGIGKTRLLSFIRATRIKSAMPTIYLANNYRLSLTDSLRRAAHDRDALIQAPDQARRRSCNSDIPSFAAELKLIMVNNPNALLLVDDADQGLRSNDWTNRRALAAIMSSGMSFVIALESHASAEFVLQFAKRYYRKACEAIELPTLSRDEIDWLIRSLADQREREGSRPYSSNASVFSYSRMLENSAAFRVSKTLTGFSFQEALTILSAAEQGGSIVEDTIRSAAYQHFSRVLCNEILTGANMHRSDVTVTLAGYLDSLLKNGGELSVLKGDGRGELLQIVEKLVAVGVLARKERGVLMFAHPLVRKWWSAQGRSIIWADPT